VAEHSSDLAQILEGFPWDPDVIADAKPIEEVWSFDLPVDAERLWEGIVDTSRLNRALGLAELELEERDGRLTGVVHGIVEQRFVEMPWSWVEHRVLVAERRFDSGMTRQIRVLYLFEPHGDEVTLTVYLGFVPRGLLGRLLLPFGVRAFRKRYAALLDRLAQTSDAPVPAALLQSPEPLPPEADARVSALRHQLAERELPDEAIELLLRHVREADDFDMQRLQPRKLAHQWELPEREVLRTCLHATRVGLLDMSWDLICPHCRGVRFAANSLGDVPKKGSCAPCALEFGSEGDNAIEVTFHVHPSIRQVPKQAFCTREAGGKRHIKVQQALASGDQRRVRTLLGPGRYRLRIQGRDGVSYLDLSGASGAAELRWSASELPEVERAAAGLTLELHNDLDEPALFIVEQANWADEALLPAQLFSFQEFRDLFSREYIGTDVQLAVGEQTILFTDIVGSTRMYLDRGDPEAFVEVRRHFAEVFRIVDEHQGAVVKTIGDATMASFTDAVRALRAARAMHEAFHPGREDTPVRLRASINTGTCIAVNLNSNIDYFGNTVNVAAKLQSCAEAGDISMSDETMHSPGVSECLDELGAEVERLELDLSSVGRPLTAHLWRTHS
jgi:class 3 adenylate cyclase